MSLKKLTISQRLAAGCGCVTFLVSTLLVLGYVFVSAWQKDRAGRQLRDAPVAWPDSIRHAARLPDLSGLTLARTDSGDAAAAARALPRRPGIEMAYRAIVGLREATAEDSATWRQVWADTSLNGVVAMARRTDWRALDITLAEADSSARRNLFRLPMPRIGNARDASRALVIRAMLRLQRGDRAGARQDLSAVTALGEQAARHEPSMLGSLIGRAQLSSAARGWERYAVRTGDSALAARSRQLLAWAALRPQSNWLLMYAPDTALVLAGDTTLLIGARGEALGQLIVGRALTPRGFVFGMPRRDLRAMNELAERSSGDMATLSRLAVETARRIRFMGFMRVMREANPAP